MTRKKNIFKSKRAQNGESPSADSLPTKPAEPAKSGAGQPQAPAPLFYRDPHPIHATRHAGTGLKKAENFGFATEAHAVALHTQEFRLAAASYPIVFTDEDLPMPLAVLGIREGENLFVDEKGQWAAGTYVPAYVRRYPFATGQGAREGEQILYVDEACERIVDRDADPDADPLFVDGEPSERTEKIREFCAAFQQQAPVTIAFSEEIKKRDLLASKEIRLDLPGGGRQLLTGLRILEEKKFNALPDDAFLEWRRNGWLPLVYWHWVSMDNFSRLLQRR